MIKFKLLRILVKVKNAVSKKKLKNNIYIISSNIDELGNRTNIIVKNDIYTISYNESYKQPNWCIYEINKIKNKKRYSRLGMDFYKEKNIITSDDSDYFENLYDKGHLAPAATFSDTKQHLYETFSYLNCSIQHSSLNRNQWEHLEDYERKKLFNTHKKLLVKVVLNFSGNIVTLKSGARVPNGFYKQITLPTNEVLTYYFPNDELPNDFESYKIENLKL